MESKEKTAQTAQTEEKMVKIRIPKLHDGGEEAQFVSVNGRDFLIKRGIDVEVPACVAEVLEHSATQMDRLDEFVQGNAN